VYMLHAVLKMFWGPLDNSENEHLPDVGGRELIALLPLLAFVFILGFFPNIFLEKMNPSIDAFLKHYSAKLEDSHLKDKIPHLLSATRDVRGNGVLALDARGTRVEAFGDERKGDER
ncbi:MAG TPA: hypothetical protein VFZ61_29730, partial [Polyangiales bacterium]